MIIRTSDVLYAVSKMFSWVAKFTSVVFEDSLPSHNVTITSDAMGILNGNQNGRVINTNPTIHPFRRVVHYYPEVVAIFVFVITMSVLCCFYTMWQCRPRTKASVVWCIMALAGIVLMTIAAAEGWIAMAFSRFT
jgi:cytochrome bd-type quinol oxidase subunit 1